MNTVDVETAKRRLKARLADLGRLTASSDADIERAVTPALAIRPCKQVKVDTSDFPDGARENDAPSVASDHGIQIARPAAPLDMGDGVQAFLRLLRAKGRMDFPCDMRAVPTDRAHNLYAAWILRLTRERQDLTETQRDGLTAVHTLLTERTIEPHERTKLIGRVRPLFDGDGLLGLELVAMRNHPQALAGWTESHTRGRRTRESTLDDTFTLRLTRSEKAFAERLGRKNGTLKKRPLVQGLLEILMSAESSNPEAFWALAARHGVAADFILRAARLDRKETE